MPKSTQKMFLASIILAGTTSMIAPQAGANSMAPPSKVLKVQGGAIEYSMVYLSKQKPTRNGHIFAW